MAKETPCDIGDIEEVLRNICRKICSIDEKTPSPPEADPLQFPGVLRIILIIFGIAFLASSIAAGFYYNQEGRNYSFSFNDGASVYSDGVSTAMILKGNGISFFGDLPLTLDSTGLTDGSNNTFDASRVTFTNTFSSPTQTDYSVDIAINPFSRGKFDGWLEVVTVGGSTVFSPISITSGPYILTPLFLVLAGVFASICSWEIVRYYKYKSDESKKNEFKDKGPLLVESVRETYSVMGLNPTTEDIEKELKISYSTYQEIEPRIQQYQRSVDAYVKRDQERDWTIFKILVIEFFSALFGIAIGLVVTYNDIITSNYLIIDAQKTILLFSIGLGAGSLKELVDR